MKDRFLFSWLHLSQHFKGVKLWGWEFHWKGSRAWYHNFKRHSANKGSKYAAFTKTRLTFRLGRWLVSFGNVDKNVYYRDVHVVKVTKGKKLLMIDVDYYLNKVPVNDEEIKIQRELNKLRRRTNNAAYFLDKAYPAFTWRN